MSNVAWRACGDSGETLRALDIDIRFLCAMDISVCGCTSSSSTRMNFEDVIYAQGPRDNNGDEVMAERDKG